MYSLIHVGGRAETWHCASDLADSPDFEALGITQIAQAYPGVAILIDQNDGVGRTGKLFIAAEGLARALGRNAAEIEHLACKASSGDDIFSGAMIPASEIERDSQMKNRRERADRAYAAGRGH